MRKRTRFCVRDLRPEDVREAARFLNDLRQNHWSLTSMAHQRMPGRIPCVEATDLIADIQQPNRIGIYLLRRENEIISMLQVDDKHGDGRVAVLSGAETLPAYQRRGTFWRFLGMPCIRNLCEDGFERLEAITWTFNRKGIPIYKRMGFRAVPQTSLIMENYIPLILKHPSLQSFFKRNDYIRTLTNRRSYGYDAHEVEGISVFEYSWRANDHGLDVLIDWQRKQIASIQRPDWATWCFVRDEDPFRIRYRLENRTGHELRFGLQIDRKRVEERIPEKVPAGTSDEGEIAVDDEGPATPPLVMIEMHVEGERVPFPIRRRRVLEP